jgi:hypothetical protein
VADLWIGSPCAGTFCNGAASLFGTTGF